MISQSLVSNKKTVPVTQKVGANKFDVDVDLIRSGNLYTATCVFSFEKDPGYPLNIYCTVNITKSDNSPPQLVIDSNRPQGVVGNKYGATGTMNIVPGVTVSQVNMGSVRVIAPNSPGVPTVGNVWLDSSLA